MSSRSTPPEIPSPAEAEAEVDRAALRRANNFRVRVRGLLRLALLERGDPLAGESAPVDDDEHTMRMLERVLEPRK